MTVLIQKEESRSISRMKATGIVAEYNPLHNGHLYHISRSRELTGCDAVVVAMSGNYVQRGEPAVMNKWTRAALALKGGADLVVEIPVLHCLGNAEQYASAGVRILTALGCVSSISFGSECGDIRLLRDIEHFIRKYSEPLRDEILRFSRQGYSYPAARARAYEKLRNEQLNDICCDGDTGSLQKTRRELRVLGSPNDILALEYIMALRDINEHNNACRPERKEVNPVAVRREGAGYSDPYDIRIEYQSASALRTQFFSGRDIRRYVPEYTMDSLRTEHCSGPDRDKWWDLLRYSVMTMPADMIEDCPSGGEGLANLMKSKISDAASWTQFVRRVQSKRYTYTRISRLCIQTLLGITRKEFYRFSDNMTHAPGPEYIRVLGFSEQGRSLLAGIRNEDSSLYPVITNINKESRLLTDEGRRLLALDIHADDIYNLASGADISELSDYRMKPVMI